MRPVRDTFRDILSRKALDDKDEVYHRDHDGDEDRHHHDHDDCDRHIDDDGHDEHDAEANADVDADAGVVDEATGAAMPPGRRPANRPIIA